jgi:hypothetical protein
LDVTNAQIRGETMMFKLTCIGIGGPRFCGRVLEPIMGGLGGYLKYRHLQNGTLERKTNYITEQELPEAVQKAAYYLPYNHINQ